MNWYEFWDYWDSEKNFECLKYFWMMVIITEVTLALIIVSILRNTKNIERLFWNIRTRQCQKGKHTWTIRTIGRHCRRCHIPYKETLSSK